MGIVVTFVDHKRALIWGNIVTFQYWAEYKKRSFWAICSQ
jgi:hypothetical protein